jgi:uncharacterized Tic20 family protein
MSYPVDVIDADEQPGSEQRNWALLAHLSGLSGFIASVSKIHPTPSA